MALHQALLHSARHEGDALVAAGTLRALGTLLLGAPYHRLPPQLLPLCVAALQARLANTTPAGGPAALTPDHLPIASACLACLAAAFSCKVAPGALAAQLVVSSGDNGVTSGAQQLLHLLFGYAASQQPALQLEATMALRGIAQQHAALLSECWEQLLALGRAGAALAPPAVSQSPRAQAGAADGTLPEKVAQQSVRLPGDYLQAAGEAAEAAVSAAVAGAEAAAGPAAALAQQWQQAAEQVVLPASQHSSPLLRAAAQAVIAAVSPAVCAALPPPLQQQLLGWCFMAGVADEASPVRAAAAKAVGAVAACPALCSVPGGESEQCGLLLLVHCPRLATRAAHRASSSSLPLLP